MPTPEEVAKLAGEKPDAAPETPSSPETPEVVDLEDYRTVVEQKEEAVKFAKRRDNEVRDLRARVKELESGAVPIAPRKSEQQDGEDEEDDLAVRLKAMGYAPKAEVRAEVEREMTVMQKAQKLKSDTEAEASKYPFVDQLELLNFMRGKGDITPAQAVILKYPKELADFVVEPNVTETDKPQRTIKVDRQAASSYGYEEKEALYPMGPQGNSGHFRNFISSSLQKAADKIAGNN